ncbi:hypothetical protein [Dickeya solani]|uniref:Uncharacterized protein n=1 Tax=Dickeya solani TaxID=1089444 RepID=A0AAX4F774_9GAMM|nr:hypothetical protein [Dickeya solani]WOA55036.1 hypothetical protein RXA29_19995 [Dickeya solani]
MVIASSKCIHFSEVVILVVLTGLELRVSLIISQLLAKAIPVRGARFRKADVERHLLFAFISNMIV